MARLNVKVTGLGKAQRLFGKQGQKALINAISGTMEIKARDVRTLAVDKVPVHMGRLKGSIDVDGKDLEWKVGTNLEYAGYVEFGTKTKISIPQELADRASLYQGKGKGSYREFKEAITFWVRKKGLPAEAVYPIMAKILNVGIEPHPFMHPAFHEGTKDLQKEVEKAIEEFFERNK